MTRNPKLDPQVGDVFIQGAGITATVMEIRSDHYVCDVKYPDDSSPTRCVMGKQAFLNWLRPPWITVGGSHSEG
jgi:hypothetical protein